MKLKSACSNGLQALIYRKTMAGFQNGISSSMSSNPVLDFAAGALGAGAGARGAGGAARRGASLDRKSVV